MIFVLVLNAPHRLNNYLELASQNARYIGYKHKPYNRNTCCTDRNVLGKYPVVKFILVRNCIQNPSDVFYISTQVKTLMTLIHYRNNILSLENKIHSTFPPCNVLFLLKPHDHAEAQSVLPRPRVTSQCSLNDTRLPFHLRLIFKVTHGLNLPRYLREMETLRTSVAHIGLKYQE